MDRANTKASGTQEVDLQMAILELMKDGRVWTNDEIKKSLRQSFKWSDEDQSIGKRGEQKWLQRVNNALAQSPKRANSLYSQGYMENVETGEHRITQLGLQYISGGLIDDFVKSLTKS